MLSSTLGMERGGDWLMTSKMCFTVVVIIQQWQVLLGTSAYFVLPMVFLFVLVLDASSRNTLEKCPFIWQGVHLLICLEGLIH